jgi:hypothetical protein
MSTIRKALLLVWLINPIFSFAQDTEIKYLSGRDCNNTVEWQFFCTAGRNSGKWTTIKVPSNWEQEGFGTYNYGHAKDSIRGKEKGIYKYQFDVPLSWKDKQVEIVFEGSMTDTEVEINGKSAGPIHQGAFYRFKYDITKFLKYGKINELKAVVAKHSANESVNKAERYADFWIFGGIFRTVYLQVKPRQNIERVAIDAKTDGSFSANVFLNNIRSVDRIEVRICDLEGNTVGTPFSSSLSSKDKMVSVEAKVSDIKSWNPESPNLYDAVFALYKKGDIVHQISKRFGFRTVEVRKRDGIYVNGVKLKLKGVNHHTFRPETGRTSSKSMSVEDVNLIKDMNMNAVRCSHYPPDQHFLDVCDSIGLFVIDELTGWHDAYDTEVGSKRAKEMVVRDVNHPSILIWDNGNEGGTNPDFDPVIRSYDIQKRPIVYPWQTHDGITAQHYRNYDYGAGTYWNGHDIVLPTEFLHGLYDGGAGSGLFDYWEYMLKKPKASGGFLWVFADEGVVRTDKNNEIDTYGSAAPDGILGPHHEKEGSFFAIKEIFSPVFFEDKDITESFDGAFNIENRYLFSNLNSCDFKWKLAKMPVPDGELNGIMEKSGIASAPDIEAGHKGMLKLNLSSDWFSYDVLYVTATDKTGREIYTWSWPVKLPSDVMVRLMKKSGEKSVTCQEKDSVLIVKAGNIEYTVGLNDGLLKKVVNTKGEIPFNNGPVICSGKTFFKSLRHQMKGDTLLVTCSFDEKESRMKEFVWTFYPSGWARLNIIYTNPEYDADFQYMGVSFDYPENFVKSVKWLGDGPYRVWKNRMHGVELGIHIKRYNDTMTGIPPLVYPEFKGYHSKLYWAKIITKGQAFTVVTSSEDVFLRLYTPSQPESVWNTAPPFPPGDISFMQAIPAMGTKSNKQENMGPSGRLNQFFDYGPYDSWRKRCKKLVLYFNFSENQ